MRTRNKHCVGIRSAPAKKMIIIYFLEIDIKRKKKYLKNFHITRGRGIIPGKLIRSVLVVFSGTRKEEEEEGMGGDRGACPASSWRTVDSSLASGPRSPWRRSDRRRHNRDSQRMTPSKYPSKTPTRAQTL